MFHENLAEINSFTEFTDDQKQLRDSVRKFVQDEIIPVAAQYDKSMEYPWDIMKKAHALGFLNTDIPEEYGEKSFKKFSLTFFRWSRS